MPAISRQVGTTSSKVAVFIPNATVSTGAGLANIIASTVTVGWWRNDMSAASSYTGSTGTLGTWGSSTLAQLSSTLALGWYMVSVPNGVFASGDSAIVHLAGAPSMAPVPVMFEITREDNQQFTSSKIFSSTNVFLRVNSPVTASSGVVSVSNATIPFGVSSVSTPVAASSLSVGVNISSIVGTAAVTSAAGVLSAGVSTAVNVGSPVAVSSGTVRVSSATIPFGVSSISIPVTVSQMTAAALGNFFNVGALFFSTAAVSSVVYEIATNATVGGDVGVSSISIPVGVSSISTPVAASSLSVGVNASTVSDKAGYSVSSVSADAAATIADKLLGRNVSSGGDGGRTVSEALYVLRNKVDAGAGIVYATDDTTSSWAFTVSTQASDPIVSITPA